ncbi:MAG: hypothetical protein COB22_05960 [Cycloclasticus sp.]|nr:MAG: hypothetical protein COB22_05960 [Cycloclasticus sp.]
MSGNRTESLVRIRTESYFSKDDASQRRKDIAEMAGSCMARELKSRGIRLDLVDTWERNLEESHED